MLQHQVEFFWRIADPNHCLGLLHRTKLGSDGVKRRE
jgi:hypothetical protein